MLRCYGDVGCVLYPVRTFHDQRHEGDDWGRQFALVGPENMVVARRIHQRLIRLKPPLQLGSQLLATSTETAASEER